MINPSRGFVTIATGDEHYYAIARNLLRSYRWFSRHPMPFAIICDRENEYTKEFDDVILISDPFNSFLDKLRLPELAPYDETLFIDSDCLAYRDLNGLWKYFSHCRDFAAVGCRHPFGSYGWVDKEGAGVFKDKVRYSMVFQGGLYFIRKGKLASFSDTCWFILNHFESFSFPNYPSSDPVDEPILALACAVHDYPPVINRYERVFCYYPLTKIVKADISRGRLSFKSVFIPSFSFCNYFLHWSTAETKGEMYAAEVQRLDRMISSRDKAPSRWETRKRIRDFFEPLFFYVRMIVRLTIRMLSPLKSRLKSLLIKSESDINV